MCEAESSGPPISFSTWVLLMPISSLANLLLAAGVPKISPSTLPSLDFTFRPPVLPAAWAGAVFESVEALGEAEGAGAGAGVLSVFWRDAQPKKNTKHAAETSRYLNMVESRINVATMIPQVFLKPLPYNPHSRLSEPGGPP